MKQRMLSVLWLLMLPCAVSANTVLYTTRDNPPMRPEVLVDVVYLDESDALTDAWFAAQGIELSMDNTSQIIAALQSPAWQTQAAQLKQAYQGVIRAWQLGVERVPAVVVDDKWVIYGLTDVARAQSEIAQYRQRQEKGG
ncbi:TIGR03757 family integrating conjugative element protein [Providencia rettgeri]